MSEWDLNWPRGLGGPAIRADFRTLPEDFAVDELVTPDRADSGEHVYLQLCKRCANTHWAAQQIARLAGVRSQDIGFCGLKDRHAAATQWFSVYLPRKPEPDWTQLQSDQIRVLQKWRGPRKLRRGEHHGNRFRIRLRRVSGDRDGARELLAALSAGVPNYFGEQRFGRRGANLDLARSLAEEGIRCSRREKAFAMSAARSWLFNQVLGERVRAGNWRAQLAGDPDTGPSGPLWGRGRNPATAEQGELEAALLAPWRQWCDWLEHCGLRQERRRLILEPADLAHSWEEDSLELSFTLPVGAFATTVLGELAELVNSSAANIE
ncbi:tRNA pseudouridine(13) synthase TruD [Microbulbifer sp. 2201CG32-9]|uniref:tRNA pseudouridine(13) synthase TruD n=1 Tax=Microbulbifer sp. 2201CG32-9 TaxID=3232309 RepID=UPI00345BA28A